MFNPAEFSVESIEVNGQTVTYRTYEGVVYVENPTDVHYQIMNIYVPFEYYKGQSIGTSNAATAPVFFPITVGGYMPGLPAKPMCDSSGQPNAVLTALSKGYTVAAPGARGRSSIDHTGRYIGKAPAAIVDLKAAIRCLRAMDKDIPGDKGKIIASGTSAGGALSALLGATGNNQDYGAYLGAMGAAEVSDDIFAVSAYCPIMNLDNSDIAYEWLFNGIDNHSMSVEQIKHSIILKDMFPAYVNNLGLAGLDDTALLLDENGEGTFRDYVLNILIASAQNALENGTDLSQLPWITVNNRGVVTDIDLKRFVRYAGRLKTTPAFDGSYLSTPENELFGTEMINAQHFTEFGKKHSAVGGTLANAGVVRLMNPMNYIGAAGSTQSQHWRIRHGSIDRDTSLAIPIILATKLVNNGASVDFSMPWDRGHGGDYDLDELFDWMDKIC